MPKQITRTQLEWQLRGALVASILTLPVSSLAAAGKASPPPRHHLSATAGVSWFEISGAAGAGTVIPAGAGSEYPNLLAPDSVDATGWQIGYAFDTGASLPGWLDASGRSSNLTLRASWASYTGDSTATVRVAAGGSDTGLLFTRLPNPVAYLPGPAGLESRATTEVDYGQLELGAQWQQAAEFLPRSVRLIPQVSLGWSQYDYRITTLDSFDTAIISPDDYRDSRDQYMQQDLFELQLGGQLEQEFGSHGQYNLTGSAGLVAYFLKATLSSFDYVTLAGNTRLRWVGEGERKGFLGAEFGLGLGWRMTPAWRAEVAANYSPWVPTATIVNPTSISDPAPRTYVATDRETNALLRAGISYAF